MGTIYYKIKIAFIDLRIPSNINRELKIRIINCKPLKHFANRARKSIDRTLYLSKILIDSYTVGVIKKIVRLLE